MQFLTGFNQEKTSKIPQKGEKTVKTGVDKNLQKTPIGDIRDVASDTDSCPKSSELSEPENNYSNTENQKTEKQKLVVTFGDKIFAKNEKFGSEKQHHSKTEPCPKLFDQKDSRSNKPMFDKRTPKPQPNQKTGQNKEGKKSTFTSSNNRMLIDSVNSNLPYPENVHITTRRAISSNMGKIFDPIGLLTPVTLQCKILFQMTWEHEIGWDDDVGATITDQFKAWMIGLHHLSELRIPRFVANFAIEKMQFHLFCDASEKAYGAAIYARSLGASQTKSTLLCSKSRLAPRKTLSIPRLELCSMVLGAQMIQTVQTTVNQNGFTTEIYAWSDSTVALAWINSTPSRFSTFIANRVAKVQQIIQPEKWRYVPTEENPADHTTRPVPAKQLSSLRMWWEGPQWLSDRKLTIPKQPEILQSTEVKKEVVRSQILTIDSGTIPEPVGEENDPLNDQNIEQSNHHIDQLFPIERYGSLDKAIRVAKQVLKFAYILLKKPIERKEFKRQALNMLVRDVQKQNYIDEIDKLQKSQSISRKSRILQLYPFIDEERVLKVGGRLVAADCLNESAKFQSILPYKNHLSRLIVLDSHQRVLHSGVNATVVHTRQKFWIIRVKTLTRSIVGNCITCFRFNGRNLSQLLGDLPQERVNPAPPFSNVGIDFAGPMPYRCDKTEAKCYLVVFVCFVTKAIHLDVTKALNTQECMKAIRRFISRRGCPARIFSDNGTNFIGSLNDLIKLKRILREKYGTDCLPQAVLDLGINWSTIPAKASHFGGLWEAGVKSMKLLLFKTIGTTANLYLDEVYTMLCQVEAVLNSRPLTVVSDDAKDSYPLNPAMLLTGFHNHQLPLVVSPIPKTKDEEDPNKRFQYLQKLIAEFWKKWTTEYLSQLQTRSKNMAEKQNLTKGDLVYITDDNSPPLSWPLGIVHETYTGNDNLVRVAKIKTGNGKFSNRPIVKLRKIPINTS